MSTKKPRKIKLGRRQTAFLLKMQRNRLLQTYLDGNPFYSLVDGGYCDQDVVKSLFKHGFFIPDESGLFETFCQTWQLKEAA